MKNLQTRQGFTLAEVLITLSIVGVIAALTIPSLISNTDEQQAKTSFKKAFATLNQALMIGQARGQNPSNIAASPTALQLAQFFAEGMNVKSAPTDGNIDTADNIRYTFSSTGNCATADACLVVVDINGTKGPNVASTGTAFNDRYTLAVNKNNVTAVAAAGATQDAATEALK